MLVYAGIDEAGYGPMFGPLVIARSVFVLPDHVDPGLPCLWRAMSQAVCRKVTDKRGRIAVDDSKKLYTPAAGLKHLERGVLSFLHAADESPDDLDAYLPSVGIDGESTQPDQLWYHDDDGGPTLPVAVDAGQLGIARSRLKLAAVEAGVKLDDLRAAVVFEDRFNRMVAATRSKARCAWTFIAAHLQHIWHQHGQHGPVVVVDRQGGRQHYLNALSLLFEGASAELVEESPLASVYHLTDGPRSMTVRFEVESELRHLPVALASMTAKYTRELLMERFNRFWQNHVPGLKPTKGYTTDGRRFLVDIESAISKLNIDRRHLVRQR